MTGGLGVLAFVLGVAGFRAHLAEHGAAGSTLDLVYRAIQLFLLEGGEVPAPVPWQLEVARFLAPAVAGYAALQALAIVFRDHLEHVRARRLRGHVVIAGLGYVGRLLAPAVLERGRRVVVVEREAENPGVAELRREGGLVVVGDARAARTLREAGVAGAEHLVVACGDDGTNAEVAVQAREIVRGRSGVPLSCLAHVVDERLCQLLRVRAVGSGGDSGLHLEFFNVFEIGARQLVREHPPFPLPQGGAAWGHAVVAGVGHFAEHLIWEAARRWQAAAEPGARLRLTLVDRAADTKAAALHARDALLEEVCELRPVAVSFESPEFERGAFLREPDGHCRVSCAYVCVNDDSVGLAAGLLLHRHLAAHGAPVVIRMTQKGGLAALLRERGGVAEAYAGLHAFPWLERACQPEALLGGSREVLARAIHERYVGGQRARGATPETNPSMVPWEALPESLRQSNREQAAHVRTKLRAVRCELAPLRRLDAERFAFTPEEIELLAEMEHERWIEERRLSGWSFGPEKELERRISPYLVPWDELPDDVKEYDRVFVRALPGLLAEAGYEIVQLAGR